MSKHKSNVHPDYYKTGGREPQGRDVVQSMNRQAYATAKSKEKEQFFRASSEEADNVPEAGSEVSRKRGPVLVKKQVSPTSTNKKERENRVSASPRRGTSSHSHKFTIGDRDAVETLMSKIQEAGIVQPSPEKLRKSFETALNEFKAANAAERRAFFHGLLTGYGVGVKLGQDLTGESQ